MAKINNWFWRLIAMSLLIFIAQVNAVITDGKPVKLSKQEKNQLEYTVCKSPFNLRAKKINAFRFNDLIAEQKRTLALVECESHGTFNNKPMRYVDDCDFVNNEWICSPPQLEILIAINGRDVKMRPWGLTPEVATDTLTTISSMGFFQGHSLDKSIGSSCDVSKTKDPEIMELKCDAVIGISFWCPQTQITGCPRVLFVSHD